MLPTFYFRHKAQALLEVRADAVEAPAEFGVTAIFVGAACVVTHIQLIATLGHGRYPHVHLEQQQRPLAHSCVIVLSTKGLTCSQSKLPSVTDV